MLDLKSMYNKIEEDAMVGADGVSTVGDVLPSDSAGTLNQGFKPGKGLGTSDILGKNCNHKKDGYMGKKCNHLPKPMKLSTDGSIRKKKKTPYEKNMKILSDAELNRKTVFQIGRKDELEIKEFISSKFNNITADIKVKAIVYFPVNKTLFIKFKNNGKTCFINADFDGKDFSTTDQLDVLNTNEAKEEFKKILKMDGNTARNTGSDDMNLWLIWGKL